MSELKSGPYQGRIFKRFSTGNELLALTEEEETRAGRKLYCLKGLSHWNPPEFFNEYALELEAEAALFRLAANILEA